MAFSSLDFPIRIIGGTILTGTVASISFWAVRLQTFPVTTPTTRVWLVGTYIIGVCSLIVGLGAAVAAVAHGVSEPLFWLSWLLLIVEVGEHFGFRWVDGQGRWGIRGRLGGAAWIALKRPSGHPG